jgi:serine protease Do
MKREVMRIRFLLFGVALLSVFALIFTVEYSQAAQNYSNPASPASFADLADKVKESVVNISTTQVVEGNPLMPFMGPGSPFGDFFGHNIPKEFFGDKPHGKMKTHALGSGFVISQNGMILTNNHVVEKATEIKIKLQTGKEYDAKLVGRDPKTDLALIQVKPDKDFPAPAQFVSAIGSWQSAIHSDWDTRLPPASSVPRAEFLGPVLTMIFCKPTPRSIPVTAADRYSI